MFKCLNFILSLQILLMHEVVAQTLCMKSDLIGGGVERVQVVLPRPHSKFGSVRFESKAEESVIVRRSSKRREQSKAFSLEVLTEFSVFRNGEVLGIIRLTSAGAALGELTYQDLRNPVAVQTYYDDAESQRADTCVWR